MIFGFTFLDVFLFSVLVIFTIVGLARGFTREVFSLGSWVGAAIITIYALPHARPYLAEHIRDPTLVNIIAGVSIFILALILLGLLASMISFRMRGDVLSGIDRILGMVFGFAKTMALYGLFYIGFNHLSPVSEWPEFTKNSRMLPHIHKTAKIILKVVPEETFKSIASEHEESSL